MTSSCQKVHAYYEIGKGQRSNTTSEKKGEWNDIYTALYYVIAR